MLCNITQNAMRQTPGGYPYPIMLCNISQNSMGKIPSGGTLPGPARGVPYQGVPCWGVPCHGGTLGVPCQGDPGRVSPTRSGWGVPCRGVPCQRGTQVGYPPGQVRMGGGGTQLGQQKEYSLHGGRYASSVHAGGLSYLTNKLE